MQITDCSGDSVELGDENIPTLGEVTFFARALSQVEMTEIMLSGFTLHSIATGKRIANPQMTAFDKSTSTNKEKFTAANSERAAAHSEQQVQGALSRQMTVLVAAAVADVNPPEVNVPALSSCPQLAPYGSSTSCHIMNLTNTDNELDSMLNKQYFPLIKLAYMPPGSRLRDKTYIGLKANADLITYDPVQFPSFCGKSASFSVWWDPRGASAVGGVGGYLLSRFDNVNANRKWSLYAGDNGIHVFGTAAGGDGTTTLGEYSCYICIMCMHVVHAMHAHRLC
jgi:hypothetical protein